MTRPIFDCFTNGFGAKVSQRLRDIIERNDPEGQHQFIPCSIETSAGEPAGDQNYFYFICGRYLKLSEGHMRHHRIRADGRLKPYARDIFDTIERARWISHLPVFGLSRSPGRIYFSEEMFAHVAQANLVGMAEFSEFNGRQTEFGQGFAMHEYIGHIWVDMDD